jgi:alpha-amylase
MATKFFSDGAVHAYFNPYDTPYDAFMNYMNVLSDFEIRLNKWFPETAEQDQIFKLGSTIIEKDMIIDRQAEEIKKLAKKVAKIKPVVRKTGKTVIKEIVKKSVGRPKKAENIVAKKVTPLKPAKSAKRSK